MRTVGRLLGAALLVVIAAALAGCSHDSTSTEADGSAIGYDGGEITEAEYVQIVGAARQCMVDLGYDATEVEKRPDGLTYWFAIEGGAVGDSDTADDHQRCVEQYDLPQAEVAYQDQNVVTGAEREVILADFAQCMDKAGFPGATLYDSYEEILDRIAVATDYGRLDTEASRCLTDYGSRLYGGTQ